MIDKLSELVKRKSILETKRRSTLSDKAKHRYQVKERNI